MNPQQCCGLMAVLGTALGASPATAQQAKGKVLVVLSSATILPLQEGKSFATGYYLNELIIPAQQFVAAGYELVFADPQGNVPSVDPMSVSPDYFGGSQAAMEAAGRFRDGLSGLSHPLRLAQVANGDLGPIQRRFRCRAVRRRPSTSWPIPRSQDSSLFPSA